MLQRMLRCSKMNSDNSLLIRSNLFYSLVMIQRVVQTATYTLSSQQDMKPWPEFALSASHYLASRCLRSRRSYWKIHLFLVGFLTQMKTSRKSYGCIQLFQGLGQNYHTTVSLTRQVDPSIRKFSSEGPTHKPYIKTLHIGQDLMAFFLSAGWLYLVISCILSRGLGNHSRIDPGTASGKS